MKPCHIDGRECLRAFRLFVLIVAPIAAFVWLASTLHTWPHGAADWIQRGGYKNTVGELCCGERDCHEIPAADIRITPTGYLIKSLNETVPFHEATPSPTGTHWICVWGGKRRCFFAPPPST